MKHLSIYLYLYDEIPVSYTEIMCHLVLNIKIEFTWKAPFVPVSHLTYPPNNLPVYASVASKDSIWILFIANEMNYCVVLATEIINDFLNIKLSD